MSRQQKILLAALLLFISLLIGLMGVLSYRIVSLEKSVYQVVIQNKLNPTVYNGVDGKTPELGKDFTNGKDGEDGADGKDGRNGLDGVDSVSSQVTIIKETAVKGETGATGKNGQDGASQELRVDPETNDLQTKRSDETFWEVLIPCEKLMVSCKMVIR